MCFTWTALGMTRAVFSFFISVTCKQQIDHYYTRHSLTQNQIQRALICFFILSESPPPSTGLWQQSPSGRCSRRNRGSLLSRTSVHGPADNVDEVCLRICPWTYITIEWVSPVSYSSLHIPRCLSEEHRNSQRSRFRWVADQGSFDGDHHSEIWSIG